MSDVPESSGKSGLPPEGGAGGSGTGSGSTGGAWIYSGLPETGYYTQPGAGAAIPPKPEEAGVKSPAAMPAAAVKPGAAGAKSGSGVGGAAKKEEKKKEGDASLASVIDTIEAIIIALIIALTFRAFIVEAFVIPTGSMAPTLLGAHFKAVCPKCGYEFDADARVGFQVVHDLSGAQVIPNQGDPTAELRRNDNVPVFDPPLVCPNCRYPISPRELPQFLRYEQMRGPQGLVEYPFAWANNGDRILVLKYLYTVMDPKRWDVIVFKEPQEAQSNYIKRCIGLPEDTIQIINGDIFVGHGKQGEMDPKQRHIERKPEDLQQSLWQLAYDNDYYASDEGKSPRKLASKNDPPNLHGDIPWINPWEPATGTEKDWKKGTTMQYAGAGPGSLWFNLVPSRAADYPPYTLNTLGYNNDFYYEEVGGNDPTPRSIVGDLRLEAVWTPAQGQGTGIHMTLGRPNNCYQVDWDGKGLVLMKYDPIKQGFQEVAATVVQGGATPVAGKAYSLAMNNVDHAVQFYIDGKKVLSYEEDWNAEQAIADDRKYPSEWVSSGLFVDRAQQNQGRANSMIGIDVAGACNLSHLKLMRDLYYTQVTQGQGTGTEQNPVTLGKDEFFALGDNSRRSSDGRMWNSVYEPLGDLKLRMGIVPRRYLLGKAFFVYWPAGFRASESLPVLKDLPLVPDAGDMRIIR